MEAELLIKTLNIILAKGLMFSIGFIGGFISCMTLIAFFLIFPKLKSIYSAISFWHKNKSYFRESKNQCPKCGESMKSVPLIMWENKKPTNVFYDFKKYICINDKCQWHTV